MRKPMLFDQGCQTGHMNKEYANINSFLVENNMQACVSPLQSIFPALNIVDVKYQ
jgi:hypothetical protein